MKFDSVCNIASVKVNGIDCGTIWTKPYSVDIKKAIKPGINQIEIEVTNTWRNKLIADELMPDKRRTWLNSPYKLKDKPLLPAGIIGRVEIFYIMGGRIKNYLLFLFTATCYYSYGTNSCCIQRSMEYPKQKRFRIHALRRWRYWHECMGAKWRILIYANRSGSLNEDNNLMKAGRIRIKCSPNPFDGKIFKQQLHLQNGYVTVDGENNGVKATIKIWVDVFNPVAHIEITANKKITCRSGL